MLPLELLNVIFGALSRDDLDALMLTNVSLRDIVLRDFAKEPLRYFPVLLIGESYELVRTTGPRYKCGDDDDLCRRMRLGRIGSLECSGTLFDENIFKVLLPHKDDCRDGNVDVQCRFASHSLFDRAFSELLFCESMTVISGVDNDDDEPIRPFLSLPAVRGCTSLVIYETPSPQLSAKEILEWLNADTRSREPKYLEMGGYELEDGVVNLVQQLKTDFAESKLARRYVFVISVSRYGGQLGRFVNTKTSEELIISCTGTGILTGHLKAVRQPVDDDHACGAADYVMRAHFVLIK